MRKLVTGLLIASFLGASLAVPAAGQAVELPTCESLGYPTDPAVACTGPTKPASTTGTSPESTGTQGPTGPVAADPQYNWVWNGTAWEAEGYPYMWNGKSWVPKPEPIIAASNENTGPGSTNDAQAGLANNTDVGLSNDAAINNTINANLNTGENAVLHNTTAGNLTSGGIKATVDLVNFINSVAALQGGTITMADIPTDYSGNIDLAQLSPQVINAILTYYVGSIFDIIAGNSNTGPESNNNASGSAANDTAIKSNQNAAINNNITIVGDTGRNTVDGNTTAGDLTTGNIDLALNLVNIINSILSVPVLDIAMLNIFGNLVGNIFLPDWLVGGGTGAVTPQASASNSTTGPESLNSADASATNNLSVNAVQNGTINNEVDFNANTGYNTVGRNTTVGNVTTGSVNAQLSITDVLNQIVGDSWFLIFVNVLGKWTGQILGINPSNGSVVVLSGGALTAANDTTGPLSKNNASATSENNTTVDHTSDAAINNSLNLDLNTGYNTVTNNTTAGNLTTGNINVVGNIVNIINQAINLNKRLYLGFINIMGDWIGSLGPKNAFSGNGVGGNTDAKNETSSFAGAPLPVPSPSLGGGTTGGSTTAGARRMSTGYASNGQIASGESIALATPVIPAIDGLADQNGQAAASPWRMISLGLLAIGAILLVADALIRRRSRT